MQRPEKYLEYAEHCERMARGMSPADAETLMIIAKAWRMCAEEAERQQSNPKADKK
jgi:hypothetical protein